MCGISGIVGGGSISRLISSLEHRGPNGWGILSEDDEIITSDDYSDLDKRLRGYLGHNLLPIVGNVPEPITDGESVLVFNGEIYNYKKLHAKSDATALFNALKKKGFEGLSKIDGVYAFAYMPNINSDEIWLGRDMMGVKPLWISMAGAPKFASEAKAIAIDPWPVLPGERLILSKRGIEKRTRMRLEREKPVKKTYGPLKEKIHDAIDKRTKGLKKAALLFSGGVDSTLLYVLMKEKIKVELYTAGFPDSQDIQFVKRAADEMGLDVVIEELSMKNVEEMLPEIVRQLETTNVMKIGVAFPFYVSARNAKANKCDVIFSGLGTEELFAGYERHVEAYRSGGWDSLHNAMWDGLETMWDRDLYRDDLATMANSVELRLPFLDLEVVKEAMTIHPKMKLGEMKKQVLRQIAREEGVPEFIATRPKKAAQYGSGVDKAIRKLAKRKGMKPQNYLEWVSKKNSP